eukprot:CAMPEP_0113691374 /NCGR_PEP_ID=MMETSP0038_2-20120614/18391_1 /TAXON_ID=2898 /ORGANISM="Cryptomonas paramecium" /LENGTH=115 /DNA_ID=CAMNT_0000612963 /DNA_START=107 /DNA_END=451 /DNA_ORIENTATION=+ /assembly_acc=CAM_ASM_000170
MRCGLHTPRSSPVNRGGGARGVTCEGEGAEFGAHNELQAARRVARQDALEHVSEARDVEGVEDGHEQLHHQEHPVGVVCGGGEVVADGQQCAREGAGEVGAALGLEPHKHPRHEP